MSIELDNETQVFGDLVISAADGHHTLFDLLKGKYLTETIKNCYSGSYPTFTSVQVSLGVNADLSNEAQWIQVRLDIPIMLAGQEQKFISFLNYCHDEIMPQRGNLLLYHTLSLPSSIGRDLTDIALNTGKRKEK
jgi:hypothetical protein